MEELFDQTLFALGQVDIVNEQGDEPRGGLAEFLNTLSRTELMKSLVNSSEFT